MIICDPGPQNVLGYYRNPPWVLSPPRHRTQSWRPCLPGQPWVSGWRSTDRPVPSPRGCTIVFSERGVAHNHALPRCLSSRRCMISWQSRGWPLSRPEAAHPPPPSSLPSTAGRPGGTRVFPRWRERSRNRPRLPSKTCKLTAALAAKAYSAAGQAASALRAMAILQVHQAKALKQVHEGSTDPGLMHSCARRLTSLYIPREGDVNHGGPGAPSLAQPGRDEGRRKGTLLGRAVRRHRRGLCPAVLGGIAADRCDPAPPAPAWCSIHRCPQGQASVSPSPCVLQSCSAPGWIDT